MHIFELVMGGLISLCVSLILLIIGGWISHRKDYNTFKGDINERLKILEETSVKESDVRHLIEESLENIKEGISEIGSSIKEINENIHHIQVENAARVAVEEALKEIKKEGG